MLASSSAGFSTPGTDSLAFLAAMQRAHPGVPKAVDAIGYHPYQENLAVILQRIAALRTTIALDPVSLPARKTLIASLRRRGDPDAIKVAMSTLHVVSAFPFSDEEMTAILETLQSLQGERPSDDRKGAA